MRPKFHSEMRDAISNVLETMFFVAPLFEEEEPGRERLQSYRFGSRIALLGDSECYATSFRSTERFARMITANFLGIDEEEVTVELMADTMKELANMTAGDLLTRGNWSRMKLGIPSVENIAMEGTGEASDRELFRLQLSCEDEPLTICLEFCDS